MPVLVLQHLAVQISLVLATRYSGGLLLQGDGDIKDFGGQKLAYGPLSSKTAAVAMMQNSPPPPPPPPIPPCASPLILQSVCKLRHITVDGNDRHAMNIISARCMSDSTQLEIRGRGHRRGEWSLVHVNFRCLK